MKIWHLGFIGTIASVLSFARFIFAYFYFGISDLDFVTQLTFYSGVGLWLLGSIVFCALWLTFYKSNN